MSKRPLSITIVGWMGVLYGLFCALQTLWTWLAAADMPEYHHLYNSPGNTDAKQTATLLIGIVLAVHIIDAFFDIWVGLWVIAGIGYVRFVYAAACLLELVYQIYMSEPLMDFLPVNLVEAIVLVILFLPNANAYFASEKS
jgi:hypothetical protein